MDLGQFNPGEKLADIKDRLGFGGNGGGRGMGRGRRDQYDDQYDDGYDDGYDDYDQYDDYVDPSGNQYDDGYDEGYDDGYAEYAPAKPAPRTRGVRGGVSSNLVNIDDVRARTTVPDSLKRDPLPERRVTRAADTSVLQRRGGRTMVSATMDSQTLAEENSAPIRSEGLNSLFAPTGSDRGSQHVDTPVASTYDPYETYIGSGVSARSPKRSLQVLAPATYADVEQVAKVLKAGDVAVLNMVRTPDQLSKRVLDFAFGVACYAEASVDCIADKVFVIARGSALSEGEKAELRAQGVIR